MFKQLFTFIAIAAMLFLFIAFFAPPDASAKITPQIEKHIVKISPSAVKTETAKIEAEIFAGVGKTVSTQSIAAPAVAGSCDREFIIQTRKREPYFRPPNLTNNNPNQFNRNLPEIVPLR